MGKLSVMCKVVIVMMFVSLACILTGLVFAATDSLETVGQCMMFGGLGVTILSIGYLSRH